MSAIVCPYCDSDSQIPLSQLDHHILTRHPSDYITWKEKRDITLAPTTDIGKRHSIGEIASPDAPTTTNEKGGSQSDIPVRFDLIDAKALFEMAKVLDHGARKYGEDNWRLIPVKDHLNHLLMHAYAYLAGDETDEHLSHIMCRATFAQGVALSEKRLNKDEGFYAGK